MCTNYYRVTHYVNQQTRRIAILFTSFCAKKINELAVTSNNLRNNFTGLVTSGLGPDISRGPPVGPRWSKINQGQVTKFMLSAVSTDFPVSEFRNTTPELMSHYKHFLQEIVAL
jgi:hypothetical protein